MENEVQHFKIRLLIHENPIHPKDDCKEHSSVSSVSQEYQRKRPFAIFLGAHKMELSSLLWYKAKISGY